MSNLLTLGAGGPAIVPASFAFTTGSNGAQNSIDTTYTFTAVTLDPLAGHHIWGVVGGNNSTADRLISSVTIDGVTATQLVYREAASGISRRASGLFIASATGASSGNVVVTWNGSQAFCAAFGGGATGLSSVTPTNTYSTEGTTLSQSINVSAGGVFVAAGFATNNTNCTWAPSGSEDFDSTATLSRCYTMASENYASTQTGLTVSATFGATHVTDTMVIAALR